MWYKAWRESEDGELLVMEISEAEAAKDVDVEDKGHTGWLIFSPDKRTGAPYYSHRIFYSEDVEAKLTAEGYFNAG